MKQLRDAAMLLPGAQAGVRWAARNGLLPRSVYSRLPPFGAHPVTSPAGNCFNYVASANDMMARSIVWDNLAVWERGSLIEYSKLAARARQVLDIGAYSGIYSLIACADGPANVIAFEPNPTTYSILERNVDVNGWRNRIRLVKAGASSEAGKARMTIPEDSTAAHLDLQGQGPEIELVRVDDVVQGPVDLIKIDAEGHELSVLAGASDTLRRHKPDLIIEALSADLLAELKRALEPYGYGNQHLGAFGLDGAMAFVDEPGHANYLWSARPA